MTFQSFQAKKWGWKGMAARMLLVPLLAGATASVSFGQSLPPSSSALPTSTTSNSDKARQLVSQAQTALKKGDTAKAEELAKQAQDLRASLAYTETRPETILAEVAKQKLGSNVASSRPVVTGEPKELLKLGRQALAAGNIDQAQDYAAQSNQAAASKSYRWGLFEDTPASLVKDVQDARKKTDRVQAEELFKKAKTLYTKQTASDTERMQNLDQALNMAYQAKNLHGDYSFWDFGDKPDSLISQIEASKVQLRKRTGLSPTSTAKSAAPSQQPTGFAAGVRQAAADKRDDVKNALTTAGLNTPQLSGAKSEVMGLVTEGRQLLQEGKVLEARAKAEQARTAAEKAGLSVASFATDKDSPAKLGQAVQSTGKEMIDGLMRDADKQLAAKDPAKAEAAMNMARELSGGLGLYTKTIDEKMTKSGLKATIPLGVVAMPQEPMIPGTLTTAAGEKLVPAGDVKVPGDMKLPGNVTIGGSQLLDQAAKELARGDLDMARKIAIQAYNSDPAVKSDAQSLLRQIDVESTAGNKKMAQQAYANAVASFKSQQYETALEVFGKIDPVLLSEEQKTQARSYMEQCLAKTSPVTAPMAAAQPVQQASASETTPGTARVGDLKPLTATPMPTPMLETPPQARLTTEKPAGSLIDEQASMKDLAFQKLRQEGLDALKAAGDAWSRGETDAAIRHLDDYSAKVKGSNQTVARQANLMRAVETRMDAYAKMKHNTDILKKEETEKTAFKRERLNANLAEQMKEEEIQKKVREINDLMKNKKFAEAERLAAQTKLLDPDNPTLTLIAEQTKYAKRNEEYKALKDEQERFNLIQLNEAERVGPIVTNSSPVALDPNATRRAAMRGEDLYQRRMTEQERRIDNTLQGSVSMKFEKSTLRDAIGQLRTKSGVNIVTDDVALDDEKISLDSVVVDEDLKDIPMKDALDILLSKARCAYVVENNVVKVTTQKRSKGRLITKVFHVMDLVTPIPEYGLSPHQTFAGAMANANKLPGLPGAGVTGPTPVIPQNGLRDGQLVSGGNGIGFNNNVGELQAGLKNMDGQKGNLAMTPQRSAYSEQLKRLITGLVRPYSWSELGGNGNLSYYDIGGALVVNQTADVIGEIQQLLDALRRLQDLSVSVEIRVVSLSEAFFERVGVDFSMNIKTNNTTLERQFATSQFRPQPFLNDINSNGVVGFSPATSFTSDLDIPIRPSSFGLSLPPFGGYQPALGPTTNGGLSLGLAFLNDIQVYMFLEAAQGNRRVNIMQAPKITLFNGQTSTVFVGDFAFFTTGLQVLNVGGQFVYLPQNTAIPIGSGFNPQSSGQGQQSGVSVTVQAVISADRRFVRLNLTPSLTALASANVPLFPITTFVTPVFEGGSQGQPIPFTQFYQQPSFTEIAAQTTVAVPDGGTVLLGGLKTMAQGRNEFGPPVLANVPYLNRLFKNIGIGTETRHVMLMVTPRIIINSEEELRQVSEGGLTGGGQ